jgi:PHD/YefM family antitoxin component YafN of YafNO toxin-antitoxin module
MKTFEIEIQAIVRKTITVTAKDQDEAVITAHEQFNVMNDEEYDQDTVNIKEITA